MDSIFITNAPGQPNLKSRINQLAKEAEELKFLVGFFYFTGIDELYQGLAANDHVILKILVGLNTDRINNQLIEYGHYEPGASINEIRDRLIKDIRVTLNGEDFDNKDYYERFGLFLQMIRDDRLIIRKTREPNHAKLYISIDHDNVHSERTFVTGSSNLTRAGLSGQAEFNVELSSLGAPEKAEEFFDQLWDVAIEITEKDIVKSRLLKLLEKETLMREITPFEAYALALRTYLDVYNPERTLGDSVAKAFTDNNYKPYAYQMDAIKQALNIIEKNHGVIIADVVGLGKSVIASAVGKALRKRGIVLCPPGLMGDKNKTSGWAMYLEQFGLKDWEIRSVGDLEKAAQFVKSTDDIEIVIVDEAHRFRNPDTEDYVYLQNICRGKKVMLLTATPFNNKPNDILALLNLFIPSKQSTITLTSDIGAMFRSYNYQFDRLSHIMRYHNSPDEVKRAKAHTNYLQIFEEDEVDLSKVKSRMSAISKEIRDVISPVTIRRNRLDLKNNPDYAEEVKELSEIDNPKEWFYTLSKEQSDFYDRIIDDYFKPDGRFKGAIYQPFTYETSQSKDELSEKDNFDYISQTQLSDFMRRLLVKRFESSFGSFEQSIRRFKSLYESALKFIERTGRFVLDRKIREQADQQDDEMIEEVLSAYQEMLDSNNLPKKDKIYIVNNFYKRDEFFAHIKSDIKMFEEIIEQIESLNLVHDDPKSGCLVEKISEELAKSPKANEPKRKIIIFTEYADTVSHLEEPLLSAFGDRVLVVKGSLSTKLIQTINQNFDASSQDQKDDYDILLSTDRISEGFNLNRAGMIINYDIPWNPVRVIQRVGRINRISKKVFEKLHIVNFFPSEKGSDIVKSREIAAAKMYLIHNTLGEDSKIFDSGEEPTASALYTRINKISEEEGPSFYTEMLMRWVEMVEKNPELAEEIKTFPNRIKVAKESQSNELLVLFKKNRLFIQRLAEEADEAEMISFEDALPLIECTPELPRLPLSEKFWENYEVARFVKMDTRTRRLSDQSVEKKALFNIKSLIGKDLPELASLKPFIDTLLEDMQDWATLPKFTLRKIANFEFGNSKEIEITKDEIETLRLHLGENYLDKEKERSSQVQQEIVIAVENQKL